MLKLSFLINNAPLNLLHLLQVAKKENIGLWNTFMLHFNSDNIQSILYCTFVANINLVDNNKDIVLKLGGMSSAKMDTKGYVSYLEHICIPLECFRKRTQTGNCSFHIDIHGHVASTSMISHPRSSNPFLQV